MTILNDGSDEQQENNDANCSSLIISPTAAANNCCGDLAETVIDDLSGMQLSSTDGIPQNKDSSSVDDENNGIQQQNQLDVTDMYGTLIYNNMLLTKEEQLRCVVNENSENGGNCLYLSRYYSQRCMIHDNTSQFKVYLAYKDPRPTVNRSTPNHVMVIGPNNSYIELAGNDSTIRKYHQFSYDNTEDDDKISYHDHFGSKNKILFDPDENVIRHFRQNKDCEYQEINTVFLHQPFESALSVQKETFYLSFLNTTLATISVRNKEGPIQISTQIDTTEVHIKLICVLIKFCPQHVDENKNVTYSVAKQRTKKKFDISATTTDEIITFVQKKVDYVFKEKPQALLATYLKSVRDYIHKHQRVVLTSTELNALYPSNVV